LFELRVDHVAAGLAARSIAARRASAGSAVAGGLIELRGELVRLLLEALADVADLLVVLLLDGLTTFLHQGLDGAHVTSVELVLVLGDLLLQGVTEVVELVAPLDLLAPAP